MHTHRSAVVVLSLLLVPSYASAQGPDSALVPYAHGTPSGLTPAQAQQAPVITFVDYLPTPPSLQELASQSDVVVHGIVQEVSAPRSNDRGVNRGLTITVKELLKGNAQARGRSTLTVEQAGGTVTTNGHTHSQQFKSPPLLEGEEVVLFLDDVAADLPLQILYGPGGIVRVATATGVVSAEPGVSFVEIVPGKTSLGDLLQSLRRSIASTR